MPSKLRRRQGFTIVELMIAISVFSVATTLVVMGVLFVSRQYQQANNRTAIEEASRAFHQQVLQAIRYTGNEISAPVTSTSGNHKAICVGNQMFIYGAKVVSAEADYNQLAEGLYVINNDASGCNIDSYTLSQQQNILPDGAKVFSLSINPSTGTVQTTFVKSAADLLDYSTSSKVSCKIAVSGREWCAVVSFESTGKRRIL